MHILLTLLNILVPPSDMCYLSDDILDPRTSPELKQISLSIAQDTGISMANAEKYLYCQPKVKTSPQKPKTHTVSNTVYCQFIKSLVNPYRIKKGVEFYITHQDYLKHVQQQYGVDPSIITAIIGVETNYGKFLGKHNVKNTIANIIANTSKQATMPYNVHESQPLMRQQFYTDELKALINMKTKHGIDIEHLEGSHAGAFGIAQFMPTSYLQHARSEKSTTPDLFNPEDAILSTANYLVERGHWQGNRVAKPYNPLPAFQDNTEIAFQDNAAITWNEGEYTHLYRFLKDDGSYDYWQTTENFEAIRHYNPRPHYAIAVHLIAEAIDENI